MNSEVKLALVQYRNDLKYTPTPDSVERRIKMIDDLLEKIAEPEDEGRFCPACRDNQAYQIICPSCSTDGTVADAQKRNAGEMCLTVWRNGNYVHHGERDAEEATLCEPDDVLITIRLRDMRALTFITPQQRVALADKMLGGRS